jgi:hypothetical protein
MFGVLRHDAASAQRNYQKMESCRELQNDYLKGARAGCPRSLNHHPVILKPGIYLHLKFLGNFV